MNEHPSLQTLQTEMALLHQQFPNAQLPPHCFTTMKVKFLDYESRTMLKVSVPVTEEMLNPLRVMQGGFITAAFDNAFGPLSYLAARNPCTTLDLHTDYIRSITIGDTLTITARVIYRSGTALHLSAEAANNKGKLIATCTANMMIINRKS